MPYPIRRELGDDLCLDCPKWDHQAGKPRPELGTYDRALIELLKQMRGSGALPEAGGLLDQDPQLMGLLDTIAASSWYRDVNHG